MSHRHSLLGSAFLIPQACDCIKAQSLQFGIVFNAAIQPWLQLIRTADACHQWHAVHIFRAETNLE
jgi:hypothetical protein